VSAPSWLLAFDTATSQVVVAAGSTDGSLLASRAVPAEHRHGERLLPTVEALLADAGLELAELRGVIVGTGPGAFTGLRAGLATAKTIAHELGIAVAGVSTGAALLAAATAATGATADAPILLLLPAGPHDRVAVGPGEAPVLLPSAPDDAPDSLEDEDEAERRTIAVDLAGRAPEAAMGRGAIAVAGLPAALLALGVARLAAGSDDPATLVPEYVTLPRGVGPVLDIEEGVSWSRDRR
jgi:tRNA threonylcarbamoyl adenosine modification protein YeaZ